MGTCWPGSSGQPASVVVAGGLLGARVRLLSTGTSNKNDPNDARSVAVAALREITPRRRPQEHHREPGRRDPGRPPSGQPGRAGLARPGQRPPRRPTPHRRPVPRRAQKGHGRGPGLRYQPDRALRGRPRRRRDRDRRRRRHRQVPDRGQDVADHVLGQGRLRPSPAALLGLPPPLGYHRTVSSWAGDPGRTPADGKALADARAELRRSFANELVDEMAGADPVQRPAYREAVMHQTIQQLPRGANELALAAEAADRLIFQGTALFSQLVIFGPPRVLQGIRRVERPSGGCGWAEVVVDYPPGPPIRLLEVIRFSIPGLDEAMLVEGFTVRIPTPEEPGEVTLNGRLLPGTAQRE